MLLLFLLFQIKDQIIDTNIQAYYAYFALKIKSMKMIWPQKMRSTHSPENAAVPDKKIHQATKS